MSEVAQLRNLDAFARLEAETLADQRGIEVDFAEEEGSRAGVTVSDIHDEDWIGYSQVDFAAGASTFRARVASEFAEGGVIAVYVDGTDLFSNLPGVRIGLCPVAATGGWQAWTEIECDIELTEGVHDVYLRFAGVEGQALFNLDYFQFE
jgi:arabinoxylan arabinofuranohydrolase